MKKDKANNKYEIDSVFGLAFQNPNRSWKGVQRDFKAEKKIVNLERKKLFGC